ncbi:hypothetical protein KUTeg_008490 [Tegillarca granosa]|uniref:BHLH domain-containing protein n=1 Tax=Tegillarca granosa TaxID=220873 RepID=A0ABQ9F995_TEGGR|nr:hypothetical protein KUTeg_008490 [Tegillarca granosa]
MDGQEGQQETPMYHTLTPYSVPSTSATGPANVIPAVIYPDYPMEWRHAATIDSVRQAEIAQYQAYMGYQATGHHGDAFYRHDLPANADLQNYQYALAERSATQYQATSSIRSSTTSTGASGKPKRKRVQSATQRRAANIRERRRMFHLNEAFDNLRKRLPAFNYEKRLSRIETLRLAITYISFMQDISNGQDPNKVKLKSYKEFEHDFYNNERENISEDSLDSEI